MNTRSNTLKSKNTLFCALSGAIALILCTALLLSSPGSLANGELDFSSGAEGSYSETLPPSDLLSFALGEQISGIEKGYIDLFREYSLSFSPRVPSESVSVSGFEDSVSITASVYTYTAGNGRKVSFIPGSAEIDGQSYPLSKSGSKYSLKATGIDNSAPHDITVCYHADLTVPKELLNALQNLAYNAGADALSSKKAYDDALEKYNAAVAEYDDYLYALDQYNRELQDYNSYLQRVAEYDAALERRRQYEQEYDHYLSELERYNSYVAAVKAYNDALTEYGRQLEARESSLEQYRIYQSYLAQTENCRSYLTAIDSAFITSAGKHMLYSTLTGPTVATVVENKQQLMDYYGASEEDIDHAGIYTEELIVLLNTYKSIRDEREKYEWYRTNYKKVRDTFGNLYSCLMSLYQNKGVRMTLVQHEKDERYRQFVSHLYMISTGLDDSVVADPNWKIGKTLLYDILEREYYLEDNNKADPGSLAWPEPVEPVTVPEITVTVPDYPSPEVHEPLAPTEVPAPEPIVLRDPPVRPKERSAPGDPPVPPVFSKEVTVLSDAVGNGTLKKRANFKADVKYGVDSSVRKYLDTSEVGRYPVITFLDKDGNLIKNEKLIDGKVNAPKAPELQTDPAYVYRFAGWANESGKIIDFSKVTSDLTVYPAYEREDVYFSITWVIGSKKYTDKCRYGELPECGRPTDKPSDKLNDYVFIGFDLPIEAAYSDATYTAQYSEIPRRYTIKWVYGESVSQAEYRYGETPVCPFEISADYDFSGKKYSGFTGWDSEIGAVSGDKTYTAVIAEGYILPEPGGEDGLNVLTEPGAYRVSAGAGKLSTSLEYIIPAARATGRDIIFAFDSGTEVTLSSDSLPSDVTGTGIALVPDAFPGALFSFAVEIKDQSGKNLPVKDIKIKFGYPDNSAGSFKAVASSKTDPTGAGDFADGKLFTQNGYGIFLTDGENLFYGLVALYNVSLDGSEHGSVTLGQNSASAGETVTFRAFADEGYETDTIKVTDLSGKEIALLDGKTGFVMPDSDVKISVSFKPSVYTIRFFVDGELFSSAAYSHGEQISVPEVPKKEGTDKVAYTFSGWDPAVVGTALESVDYYATFIPTELADNDYMKSRYTVVWPVKLILIAAAALLIFVGIVVFVIVRIVKRKKKKKSAAGQSQT